MRWSKGAGATLAMQIAALPALAVAAFVVPASAQVFPDGRGGPAYSHDLVTGYQCVDNTCTVLRLPGTNCICTKQNPGEQNLSRLRLSCSTRQHGQWISCPYQPRYGT